MLVNPKDLRQHLDRLEEIERASLRLVTQAIYDYRMAALEIFREESDLVADIGEDIGRNSPKRGEEFRVRIGFSKLKQKATWRMQKIPMPPDDFHWDL